MTPYEELAKLASDFVQQLGLPTDCDVEFDFTKKEVEIKVTSREVVVE